MNPSVGIVVPTLGKRYEYLIACLNSLRAAGNCYILVVSPSNFDKLELIRTGLVDEFVNDPGTGLSEAINLGIRSLPSDIEFVNWLGDDDLLSSDSLKIASKVLSTDPEAVMVFGVCDYIDSQGKKIWTNRSGKWAVPLLSFGPDLIPQPGALFRRLSFEEAGGLNPKFHWAFDFDLFIRFSKLGRLKYLNTTLASFRWHPESLSVEQRLMSVNEASRVRISHLPKFLRPISALWEYPVRQATLIAGNRLTEKAKSKA